MLNAILIFWFVLTALSLIYITYDLIKVTPEAPVMKWGWWLVTLYTGPIGLFFYLLSCKEPIPGTHEAFVAPHWKQALGSMVHCLAGDVTGIILAAIILAFFRVPLSLEIAIEYIAGFAFGLLIFQSLFMKNLMKMSYGEAVMGSFYPEFVSMNMIMAGMIPTMVIWTKFDPSAISPATLSFWGKMSLASLIAGLTAYPINSWLVKNGLKHGMMTIRKEEAHEAMQKHEQKMEHRHSDAEGHQHGAHGAHGSASQKEKWNKLIMSVVCLVIGIAVAIAFWHL